MYIYVTYMQYTVYIYTPQVYVYMYMHSYMYTHPRTCTHTHTCIYLHVHVGYPILGVVSLLSQQLDPVSPLGELVETSVHL